MKGDGLRALAGFAAGTRLSQLPAVIVEKAKACLLYGLAVGVAGTRVDQPSQAARACDAPEGGEATRFLDGRTCAADRAAFANGTLFHARVQDDAHPAGHVGVVVLPAAVAMAEATSSSGADLLAALVGGYETALRIGRDHAADLSARGFRTTPAYGVFGAAAGAARLLQLNGEKASHALALAANMAGGLREFAEAGSEDFPFQAGLAASNGILAARLAAAGATGPATALDGAAGFFRAFGESGRDYGARLTEGLGGSFEIEAVTYKPYPICQFHRGIVRGCEVLRARASGTPLGALTIRMNPFEADFFGVRYAGPFATFPQTFMSAPFCAALAWARGAVTFAGLHDFRAADVRALVPRIEIVADPGRARYAPHLTARLDDGATQEWEAREQAGAYTLIWDAACRMTEALCAEVDVPQAHARRLIDIVAAVDTASSIEPLVDAMRLACRKS